MCARCYAARHVEQLAAALLVARANPVNSYPNLPSDLGMAPQFLDPMMDQSNLMDQGDLSTPSPSFANRPNPQGQGQGQPGTPMMDMNVPQPRNMEDMNRIYAVSTNKEASSVAASLRNATNSKAVSCDRHDRVVVSVFLVEDFLRRQHYFHALCCATWC